MSQDRISTDKLTQNPYPETIRVIDKYILTLTYDTNESTGVSGSVKSQIDYVTRSDQQTNLPNVDVYDSYTESIGGGVSRLFYKLPYVLENTNGTIERAMKINYRQEQLGLDQTWYIEITAWSRNDIVGNTENFYVVQYSNEFFTT